MPRLRSRRVFGYARVSSEEQAKGSSLSDQRASIEMHAKSLGLRVTKFFVEAESAVHEKIEKREQLQALRREIKRGDLVVVDKVDRWSRDPEYTYASVREILAAGADLFFVAERLDPSTSEGDTALGFRILFAREEHKRIKERMVGTRRRLRDQGYYADGQAPFGYRRRYEKGYTGVDRVAKNILVIDEKAAPLVRRMFIMCAAGMSIAKIAGKLGGHRDLLDPLHKRPYASIRDLVADTIHKRTYLGEIQNTAGAWIKAKHEPIVDRALFVKANEALAARKLGGARPPGAPAETDTWILRDVAYCLRCGARMSAAYAGSPSARRYYYRCFKKCTSRYVPVRLVELAVEPLVLARLAELRDDLAREPPKVAAVRNARTDADERVRLERKRARYIEMYSDGVMAHDAMLKAVQRVDADLLRVTVQPVPNPLADKNVRRGALREVTTLERAWRAADPHKRRAIMNELATRVLLAADELPRPAWRTPEDLAVAVE